MAQNDEPIITRKIIDDSGRVTGQITGRKSEIEKFTNHDLYKQLERDRQRQKDRQNGR